MYTKHHTRAFILASHDSGEADKVFALLTPDFGKVYAKAHGVREHHARHKASLQSLSEAQVSLVRGKNGWRITNVSPARSLYKDLANDRAKLSVLVRVLKLVRRLVAGEGNAEKVFAIISAFSDAITKDVDTETLSSAETLTVLRLLSVLGYLKQNAGLDSFIINVEDLSKETLSTFHTHKREAVKALNESLEATHL
ncbi:MAG: recombination protein O N-terminal domain-containing protein [Candidatus Pacebacteria bacterium]|nr:recombination protein O N-terminal domain-containing protein [Candidatus Paceibacterota bacterium]